MALQFQVERRDVSLLLDRVVRRLVKGGDGKWKRDRATMGDPITSKTKAEAERDRLRAAIRNGTIQHTPTTGRSGRR